MGEGETHAISCRWMGACLMIAFPSHRQMAISGFVFQTGHGIRYRWGVKAKIPNQFFLQHLLRAIPGARYMVEKYAPLSILDLYVSLGSPWTHLLPPSFSRQLTLESILGPFGNAAKPSIHASFRSRLMQVMKGN